MKIAYFSPFNPIKSGISDFSEELILELGKECEIAIFASNGTVSNEIINKQFTIYDMKDYYNEELRAQFDVAIFHIGNSYLYHNEIVEIFLQYGGVLEIHDIAMHHFLAEATVAQGKCDEYVEAMSYCHGNRGRQTALEFLAGKIPPPWECDSLNYNVIKCYIDRADAIIVHSDLAYQIVKGIKPNSHIQKIQLHTPELHLSSKAEMHEVRRQLDIEEDKLIIGAFGYASKEKRIIQILEALSLFKRINDNFCFYIVGRVAGIDIESELKRLDLVDSVIVKGFVELDTFKKYMKACNVAFNLRYPTQGESSASLVRLLGMGKSVFVTDVGTFSEYPDDVVFKVSYGENEVKEIYEGLLKFSDKADFYSNNAYRYALENNNIITNAKKYKCFFEEVMDNNYSKNYPIDNLLDCIFEYGIDDEEYVDHLSKKMMF